MTTGQAVAALAMNSNQLAAMLERRGITPPCKCGGQTFIGRDIAANTGDATQLRCAGCLKQCQACTC